MDSTTLGITVLGGDTRVRTHGQLIILQDIASTPGPARPTSETGPTRPIGQTGLAGPILKTGPRSISKVRFLALTHFEDLLHQMEG